MKTGLVFRPRANEKSGSFLSRLLFGRAQLRNQFGFLSAQYGFSYRWQLGTFFGKDRRKNKREIPIFTARQTEADQEVRSHKTGRWGLALTQTELAMTNELETNAHDMQAQTTQMEQDLFCLAPQLEGADISETARQAFARLDQMMERWHLKADDLQRKMMSPAVRQQFSAALPARQLSPSFFLNPRLNQLQQKAGLAPSVTPNRRSASRPQMAPAFASRFTGSSTQAPQAAKASLQQRIQAVHTHAEQLSVELHAHTQNSQQRVFKRRSTASDPALKPKLIVPSDKETT